jgi:UDP-N-acetylglucosamine transferase subunit ALG13
MIFVTVGSQMPFDRLVMTVDSWARECGRTDVFAQIGTTTQVPRSFPSKPTVDTDEYSRLVEEADVIISHAGMGTILTALERGKPLLVMPRLGKFDETRNDHQVATAKEFASKGMVHVAWDEKDLLVQLAKVDTLTTRTRIGTVASPELLTAIRTFIFGDVHAVR